VSSAEMPSTPVVLVAWQTLSDSPVQKHITTPLSLTLIDIARSPLPIDEVAFLWAGHRTDFADGITPDEDCGRRSSSGLTPYYLTEEV